MAEEGLLLSYTYFLNADCSKYISVGYNTETFKPQTKLHHVGVHRTTLGLVEWMYVFVIKNDEFSSLFTSKNPGKIQSSLKSIDIKFKRKSRNLVINGFEISEQEWLIIVKLSNFIQSVLYWCKQTRSNIVNYYQKYVEKCRANNVSSLDVTHFFVVDDNEMKCNYSRLFYEITILCKTQLLSDILK